MDYTLTETLKNFPPSPTALSKHNTAAIHELFPVPKEQTVLWADVKLGRRASGLVLTDSGIFIRGGKDVLAKVNAQIPEKKEKVHNIYHYIKWEYFSPEDFETEQTGDRIAVRFNGRQVLELLPVHNFFRAYSDTYQNIVQEATVSASSVFSEFESVIPANFAYVNRPTGHGEMAEEALTMLDKMTGADAQVLGRDQAKNGPDRFVNGTYIQTKYYASGRECINACFDQNTGMFRYQMENGELMMIEVPKDKYAESVNQFRKKILEGKVPGVTNPNDASKYVKSGRLTYQQARNLCKPGTIESLTYDAGTGAVNCSFAFGITFLTTFVMQYSQTGDRREAMRSAFAAGIQVFGLSFFAHMFTQQVARTTLTKQLIPLSTYVVNAMGYKAVQTIVNAMRAMVGKGAISGAAAMKQLAKILRSNVVTSAITLIIFSAPDTYNIFRKRISSAQYTKNMLSLFGTMAAAGGGTLAASVAAAKVGAVTGSVISPGVGTAIGIGGGLVGGLIGGSVIKIAGDAIREDDTVIVSRLFNGVVINLIYEYMLSESEIDVVIEKFDAIKPKDFKKLFQAVLASDQQEKVIADYIRHYFEAVIRTRPKVAEPNPEDLVDFLAQIAADADTPQADTPA